MSLFKPRNLSAQTWLAVLVIAVASLAQGCGSPERSTTQSEKSEYERGITALEMFDFQEAYLQLTRAYPDIPKSDPRWMEATYAYALASWHCPPPDPDKIEKAVGLFRELLAADIPDDWKARVRLSLARIYEVQDFSNDEIDLTAARDLYRELQKEYPAGEFGYQATLRLAQSYAQELTDESTQKAISLVSEQIERDPQSPWAPLAWQYVGTLYAEYLGDLEAGLKAYQKAESMGFVNESRAHYNLWQMAAWANELGQMDEAARIWTRIVVDYPRSPYGTVARDNVREYARNNPDKGITPPELQTW